ncbi:MAG: 4-hydroxy-3-polyprenylbenzoate decarboxylase [Pirellulaceae bacterium]|jgi:4-hydroxy-3-polyprenylbenzoate decarboxylase
MGYRSLLQCVNDLQKHEHLVAVDDVLDANLEIAEIQRRVFVAGGPAVLFNNVRDCQFPMVSNLFGTMDRARFMFRDTLESVRRAIELKIDPNQVFKNPIRYWNAPFVGWRMLPQHVSSGPVDRHETRISKLPQLKSWPDDGGAFITLPQVYSEDPDSPGLMTSNLGMYRVQLSGGQYAENEEIGLHYQIHRGIGVHHAAAIRRNEPFPVNVFLGGTPAMTLAAVMPLPEGMSELTFAGALAGHRIRMSKKAGGLPHYAEADFCISGTVYPDRQLPEGPFGDHLGYYSLAHDFPVLKVNSVRHRQGAIWPFTVVGRPPQEDTVFGELIHELTGPIIPTVIPGVHAVHAVDASGVHPLLLAVGSERYMPHQKKSRPQELLTQANAILGQGQMSLAKYLFIVNRDDDTELDIHHIERFLTHVLRRVDWTRDLHFQTRTTIDTLDYSGDGFNEGSKLVVAANGPPVRSLATEVISDLNLPEGYSSPRLCFPGCLAVQGPKWSGTSVDNANAINNLCQLLAGQNLKQTPLVVVVDDSEFTARVLRNFLWVVFTRSNPAADVYGVDSYVEQKHWGCRGPLVIDARIKHHHAPPLVEDAAVTKKIDAMAARGGPLAPYL